jgi:hypothetical protein
MIPLLTVTLTEEEKRRAARVFRAPLNHLGRSLDCAAREASDGREREMDVRQLARQLSGDEGSLQSLWKQGREYLQWLAVEIVTEYGLPKETRRAMLLRRVSVARKAQARMALTQKRQVG